MSAPKWTYFGGSSGEKCVHCGQYIESHFGANLRCMPDIAEPKPPPPANPPPAAPRLHAEEHRPITKREWFAAMAMVGLRASKLSEKTENSSGRSTLWTSQDVAYRAVRDADALLAELAKKTEDRS